MTINKKITRAGLLVTVIAFSVLFIIWLSWVFHWESPRDRVLKQQGQQVVLQIETFKKVHGRLPDNLRELGLAESEDGPIYYNKNKDGLNYSVSFSGATIGESVYYDSYDGLWHD